MTEEEGMEGRSTEGWRAKPHVGGENEREQRWNETQTERNGKQRREWEGVKEGQIKMNR